MTTAAVIVCAMVGAAFFFWADSAAKRVQKEPEVAGHIVTATYHICGSIWLVGGLVIAGLSS